VKESDAMKRSLATIALVPALAAAMMAAVPMPGKLLNTVEASAIYGGACPLRKVTTPACISGAVPDVCTNAAAGCASLQCAGTCPNQNVFYQHVVDDPQGSSGISYSDGGNGCGTFTCKPCSLGSFSKKCGCDLFGSVTFNCKYSAKHIVVQGVRPCYEEP
jgi:hypothetical protein